MLARTVPGEVCRKFSSKACGRTGPTEAEDFPHRAATCGTLEEDRNGCTVSPAADFLVTHLYDKNHGNRSRPQPWTSKQVAARAISQGGMVRIPDKASLDGRPVRRIVIVGGGSAGWIAAARIAARNANGGGDGITVTLIESATQPTIGVGEGTWPTMRNTLARIGISETEFIRGSDAAFKQGARFVGWTHGTPGDSYYHPLNPPVGATEMNLSPHWVARSESAGNVGSFADCVDFQGALCDRGLAPKLITHPEYTGMANYAYHLDAGKFAGLLKDHAVNRLGVRHIVGDVVDVEQTEEGDIRCLKLHGEQEVQGDLFVDCSGFKAILIGGVYKVPL